MNSLVSLIGIVLSGKENYWEWLRKVKNTLIFNDLWDGIYGGKEGNSPDQPDDEKHLAIWKSKDKKAYALISTSVSEEVSRYIAQNKTTYDAITKLKELYDSHSELEIIQLLLKLFNLEMKDNDPLNLAFQIKAINHEIESTVVKVDLQLTAFIKALYFSYSHYLESLQASEQLKELDFDKLVGKIAEREKHLARKKHHIILILKPYVLLKKIKNLKKNMLETLRVIESEVGRIIEARGAKIYREIDNRTINKEILLIKQL